MTLPEILMLVKVLSDANNNRGLDAIDLYNKYAEFNDDLINEEATWLS